MRLKLAVATLALLSLPVGSAMADSFWRNVISSGATTGSNYLTFKDHKLIVAAQDDAGEDEGAGRFQLWGIVAPVGAAAHSQGVALISVDGQPARPWRTGAVVSGDTVLLSVSKRAVQLGPKGGPVSTELTLPDPDSVQRSAPNAGAPLNRPGLVAPVRPMMQDAAAPQAQPGAAPAPAAQDDE